MSLFQIWSYIWQKLFQNVISHSIRAFLKDLKSAENQFEGAESNCLVTIARICWHIRWHENGLMLHNCLIAEIADEVIVDERSTKELVSFLFERWYRETLHVSLYHAYNIFHICHALLFMYFIFPLSYIGIKKPKVHII